MALCFPDLYEIGMSNNAMRILYTGLNALAGIRCERVFAPARDFERLLRDTGTPLYTLESGIPLSDVDVIAFTIGYELSATNILTVLDLGGIPLEAKSRGDEHPLVIAGGPAVTNPLPLSRFLDAFWIGEAEAGFFQCAADLAELSAGGRDRSALLSRLGEYSAVWMPGKKAVRAVDMNFPDRACSGPYPWPAIKPVQDHGTVEIMRGCPNGCRFCHAGYFYRPQRVRSPEIVFREVESLVLESGYREITLSSLSSGDYPGLVELVRVLNRRWADKRVSFQLPSLKVESFDLPVLEELTHTRKSGLTFAVETPEEAWQRSINKSATLEKILSILKEAGQHGYRLAKFYFMIGLPIPGISGTEEAEALVDFLKRLLKETPFQLNVNIGTFIPKPHTPFQWSPQISEEDAVYRLRIIREPFRYDRRIKISFHTPFVSTLEGILSRGDERVGDIILSAWRNGARLDAWEELMDRDSWTKALADAPQSIIRAALDGRSPESALPWDTVSLRISRGFLKKELLKTAESVFTRACGENCTEPCGTCNGANINVLNKIHSLTAIESASFDSDDLQKHPISSGIKRLVIKFHKIGEAAFIPHHTILDTFIRAFQLAKLPVAFSQGYNPSPKLEIEDPIPLGMFSLEDYLSLQLIESIDVNNILDSLNNYLPKNLGALDCALFLYPEGRKIRSLSSLAWGSDYLLEDVPFGSQDKLEKVIQNPRLAGSEILSPTSDTPGTLSLRLRFAGVRELGFGTLFQTVFGEPFSKSPIRVTRIRQWADTGNGPAEYFHALSIL